MAEPVLAGGGHSGGSAAVATDVVAGVDQAVDAANGPTMRAMLALSGLPVTKSSDGAAVVDGTGAVIGIDTDIAPVDDSDAGTSYAVPIDNAARVANQLIAGLPLTHPWIGVDDAAILSRATAEQMGLSGGAAVGTITPASPAARTGLAANDIITGFAGRPVTSPGVLTTLLAQSTPGRRCSITWIDRGVTHRELVTVGEQPTSGT